MLLYCNSKYSYLTQIRNAKAIARRRGLAVRWSVMEVFLLNLHLRNHFNFHRGFAWNKFELLYLSITWHFVTLSIHNLPISLSSLTIVSNWRWMFGETVLTDGGLCPYSFSTETFGAVSTTTGDSFATRALSTSIMIAGVITGVDVEVSGLTPSLSCFDSHSHKL